MRKIVLSLHTSLDGFVAGPAGEMDWIKVNEEMFDLVGRFTDDADVALYGRITYEMMDGYWPTAADHPNPSKHDIDHSTWYKKVHKLVLSRSCEGQEKAGTTVAGDNFIAEVKKLKERPGKNMIIFGSPSMVHLLMEENLVDEYWLFVNPIILGEGIPLFLNVRERIPLKHISSTTFSCGVTGLNYIVER